MSEYLRCNAFDLFLRVFVVVVAAAVCCCCCLFVWLVACLFVCLFVCFLCILVLTQTWKKAFFNIQCKTNCYKLSMHQKFYFIGFKRKQSVVCSPIVKMPEKYTKIDRVGRLEAT